MDSPAIGGNRSARTEFDGTLVGCETRRKTPPIKSELAAVAVQWEWFQIALGLQGAVAYGLIVVNLSEAILNSMELVTGIYEQLPET